MDSSVPFAVDMHTPPRPFPWLHEQTELMDVQRGIERNMQQTKSLDENLEEGLGSAQEIELKMQKLGQIVYVTEERLKRMLAKSVVQELQDILDDEQETHRPDASGAAKSNDASLAETVSICIPSPLPSHTVIWFASLSGITL